MSTQQTEAIVRRLACKHFELEKGIEQFVWFKNGGEKEIHVIEVNQNTIPEGSILPFYLKPNKEFPILIRIADITPEEWEKAKTGEIPLPGGWSLEKIKILKREDVLSDMDGNSQPGTG